MKDFTMNDKAIVLPESWLEVTWERFYGFTKLIDKHTKKIETYKEENPDDDFEFRETIMQLDYNTEVLSYWTGVSLQDVSHWDLVEANDLMKTLSFVNQKYQPIDISSFKIGEEEFFLPKDLMRKSSFGRYIEAEQLELQSNLIQDGHISYMPRQLAILCKKEGEDERLNDDLIDKRAKMFEKLDMATIWDVAFFLNKLEQGLLTSFLISQEVAMQKLQEQQKVQ
jgi:hypothetical protein